MSDFFSFRFKANNTDHVSSLAIFMPLQLSKVEALNKISKIIKDDVDSNLCPLNVYLLLFNVNILTLKDFMCDLTFKNEFEQFISGDINKKLILVKIDDKGNFIKEGSTQFDDKVISQLKIFGIETLFKKYQGLVVSSNGYHFVKPSGDHCTQFIRASNLLVSSVEVSFLAIFLLPYLNKNLTRIYVDTSSIAFLICQAIQRYSFENNTLPSIISFSSYAIFNEPFDFVEDNNSLVFISATTSGSLAKKIFENHKFHNTQVITLFFSNLQNEQIGVFKINDVNSESFKSEMTCAYCKSGSKLVRISGDQFLPASPKHELLVIKKIHFDKKREQFFQQFACKNVMQLNLAHNNTENSDHFYLNVEEALSIEKITFSTDLKRALNKHLTFHLQMVIYCDDPGSIALKKIVESHFDAMTLKPQITWVNEKNLDHNSLVNCNSVLVLAGAITSGRRLLNVSRDLRYLRAENLASITYLVAFSKMSSNQSFQQLKKDLEQGGHSLVVIADCFLPRVKDYSKTAWTDEKSFLNCFNATNPFVDVESTLNDFLKTRNENLEKSESINNNLFLPKADKHNSALELRPTFAFWSSLGFDEARMNNATQGDVYWTINSLLHDQRTLNDKDSSYTPYHITLLSPFNFDRYNDGVIQACLLRAAHPSELDYRVDENCSLQMTDIILSVLKHYGHTQGEAVLEFLMALCTKRLQVTSEHLDKIKQRAKEILAANESGSTSETFDFMLNRLLKINV